MKTAQICPNGHSYFGSSHSPACPICAKEQAEFLDVLALPARRALENAGITSLEKLSFWSEEEVLQFHGVGKTSLPLLRQALVKSGLDFRKDGLAPLGNTET